MTWKYCSESYLFGMEAGKLYEHLSNLLIDLPGKETYVQGAFKSRFKKAHDVDTMRRWMIEFCSERVPQGQGFLELRNL